MKYCFFVTSEMESKIAKMNLSKVIADKLKADLSGNHPLSNEAQTSSAKVKVQRMNIPSGPRLIFFEEIKDDTTLYVLREIYTDHDTYMRKFNNIKNVPLWMSWYQYSEDEILEIELKFDSLKEKVVKDILPEEYRKYEQRPRRFEASKDMIIYELLEWVNGYTDVDDLYKKSVYDALVSIIIEGNYDGSNFDTNGFYKFSVEGYEVVLRMDVSNSVINGVYLLQISESVNIEELVEHKYNCKDIQLLRRKAAKCYPDFLLYDFKSWKAIEDDSQANLALSDEELEILQHIDYPFFVSGLAGSGKSTILYYLYAHIYDYESKHHPDHPLLFLSYSKKLVANAQSIVKSILCNHPAYNSVQFFDDKDRSRQFDRSFQPFQEFIKTEFLSMDEYEDYASTKYIDYQRFKQLYESCKLPEKKNYSSDIVWSVIRTFIKGKSINSFFSPLEYESADLPLKDRTVTMGDYRQIYKIWENWYKKFFDDHTGWDDLDLVRFALSKYDDGTRFHKYAVIFCDEAQDFTKIETDLILKLSVYSKYDLTTREEDSQIPIAFAGDPNQTINPTGFRWGSTQEIFNESFKDSLASFTGFKPNELRTNYRSREAIVKFANTIQFIRHRLLSDGKQHFSLQEAWDSEQSGGQSDLDGLNYVAFYSLDKNREKIVRGMQKAIIITAEEGEYNMDHKQTDPELKDIDPSKLYTAITAKGLEFKATILFKFGSDPAITLFDKLMKGEAITDDSVRYQLSHFFTKLYIAISRAKQVLFIVDTDEGYERLWKYFVDKDLWAGFINKYQPSCIEDLGRISLGNILDFDHRLADNYKPKEVAESLFKNALENEDPETMNRARSTYKEARLENKASLCRAYISKFKKEYSEAGRRFFELGHYGLALDAYWEGCIWDQVLLILQIDAKQFEGRSFKRAVANFMSHKSSLAEFLKAWKENEDEFQDSLSNPKDRDLWSMIVQSICGIARSLQPKDITAALLRDLDRLSDYVEWFENGMSAVRAELHFKRAEFDNRGIQKGDPEFKDADYLAAIKCWDALPEKTTTNEYYTAKKLVSSSPSEEIIWMEKLNEVSAILSKYGSAESAANLSEDAQNRVFGCLLATDMKRALAYPYPKDPNIKWNRLYTADRLNFLRIIILKEFTTDKFEFLKGKIAMDDHNVFETKLPADVFESIFAFRGSDADGRPYWSYFVSDLKNREEERVFKNPTNRDTILDTLGDILKSSANIDKPLATCFLEMLFDQQFNSGKAKKHLDVLAHLFNHDIFFKEDFRLKTKRNAYFTQYCPLEEDEVDRIKGNVRKFVLEYMTAIIKKIQASQVEKAIKPLFMAFEICTPYQNSYPDYATICDAYKRFKNNKLFELPSGWMHRRYIFNQLLEDSLLGRSTYAQIANAFKERDDDLQHFVRMLGKEDSIMYIIATNRNGDEYSYDSVLLTAKILYEKRLRRDDFSSYCKVNQLRDAVSAFVDRAINELLSNKQHVMEYEMKLLTFAWEALGDHTFAAAHYDDLIDRKRLDKVTRLRNYFKHRALLHYSYLKQKQFEEKQLEYKVSMAKDYLPATYPKIEEENESSTQRKSASESEPVEPAMNAKPRKTPIADEKTVTTAPAGAGSGDVAKASAEADRKARIEMAHKMKLANMSEDMIVSITGLTKAEVRKA